MFVVANEMELLDREGFAAFPCVKALTRDIHRYQKEKGFRKVPLIYSNADQGGKARLEIANYLTCELESPDDVVDAFGLNVYSWCDPSYGPNGVEDFKYSPYEEILKDFKSLSKPFLFTEFGCNTGAFETECPAYKGGRTWVQVAAMIKNMGDFLNGAVAFEFSMENNQYGLVITPGFLQGQNELVITDNYYALKKEFTTHNVNPTSQARQLPLPKCISKGMADELQRREHVRELSDWSRLPPTPVMPEETEEKTMYP